MTFPTNSKCTRLIALSLGLILLILLMLSAAIATEQDSIAPAPGTYTILSDDGRASFPFDIYRGDIRFEGKVNGHDVHLLLDDGFMWDQLLFWGQPKVDSLGLVYEGEIEIGGGNEDEAMVPARTASGIDISFPGVEITDQDAVITAYSSGTASMWSGSVGQVSGAFLKQFVVDINFDDMTITLIDPERFEYSGKGVAVPWTPMEIGPMSIPGKLGLPNGRTVAVDMMMDLGYNHQLQITATGENKITPPENCKETGLGRNIQGIETRGCMGRIPTATIGGYEVGEVMCSFVSEEHSDHTYGEVMIGLGLLSRFNLVFDYVHQKLYVEPNGQSQDPFEGIAE